MSENGSAGRARGIVETHSIDFIPLAERRGRPWHLFTLWFGANSVYVSIVTGAVIVSQGMSFYWAVLAIIIGFGLGGFLEAFHAAQGPHLGIPQMLQSRAQFGYVGGVIPMGIAELNYVVFFSASPAVCGLLVNTFWGLNVYAVTAVATVVMFLVALFGYDVAHRLGQYLTVASVVVFGIFTVALFTHSGLPDATPSNLGGGFDLGTFLFGVSLTFVYAAGYAPYIADYSRYLPKTVSVRATGWWSYLGVVLSGIWLFVLGAYLTQVTGFSEDTVGLTRQIADSLGSWFTYILVVVIVLIQTLQGSLSLYAGGNTGLGIATSLQRQPSPITPNLKTRLSALVPFSVLCLVVALLYAWAFKAVFSAALSVILILLIPWSAINLVDFYCVRRGKYQIDDIFNPRGVYGSYNIAGIVSFVLAVVAEMFFVNFGFFQGPVASLLGGGDLAWVVGIVVSGGCYLLMSRRARRHLTDEESAATLENSI